MATLTAIDAMHECTRQGIRLTAVGGRLEARPAVRDDRLREAIHRLKADLLRVLQIQQAVGGRIMREPIRPVPPRRQADPRDYDTSDIDLRLPPGWTRKHWIDRLRYVASGCEGMHPARAKELRQQADELADPMGGCRTCHDPTETGGLPVHARGLVFENSTFTKG